jgi:hypothetical protein
MSTKGIAGLTALKLTTIILGIAILLSLLGAVETIAQQIPGTGPAARTEIHAHVRLSGIDHNSLASGVNVGSTYVSTAIGHDAGKQALSLLAALLPQLAIIATLVFTRQLMISIDKGDLFEMRNVRKLGFVGLALLFITVATMVRSAIQGYLVSHSQLSSLGTGWSDSSEIGWAVGGFGLLVLVHVVSRGIELRTDLEGTV